MIGGAGDTSVTDKAMIPKGGIELSLKDMKEYFPQLADWGGGNELAVYKVMLMPNKKVLVSSDKAKNGKLKESNGAMHFLVADTKKESYTGVTHEDIFNEYMDGNIRAANR